MLHRILTAPVALEALPGWIILLVLVALATGVGLVWRSTVPLGIATAGWLCFALLDWGLLAGLPRTRRSFGPIHPSLLALALLRAVLASLLQPAGSGWLALTAMAAVTGLVWYATWVEPFQIRVTEQKLAFHQWSPDTPPLRLLHLSDLHLERNGLREERLNDLIAELCPDLICFSGDILSLSHNVDRRAIAEARAVIDCWRAPLGVYAVTGSPLVDLPEAAASVLEGLPHLRWLCDESGAIGTSSVYGKRFEMGCYNLRRAGGKPLTLYVSRGIGVEGGIAPRARFLCRPEIILWTLWGSH